MYMSFIRNTVHCTLINFIKNHLELCELKSLIIILRTQCLSGQSSSQASPTAVWHQIKLTLGKEVNTNITTYKNELYLYVSKNNSTIIHVKRTMRYTMREHKVRICLTSNN